ncbi:hypothetical protein CK203_115495 [Vitis vinifera]|uniref:Uncharacterized protein n=1 Tax=Vitis vinifera TaxID=29760 RepID=A0A438D7U8_VITVI|nr:hypothetical protein CK203_115495 [Vitis vinifera]
MRTPTKKFSNGLLFCCWLVSSSKSSSFTNLYCELHHDILNGVQLITTSIAALLLITSPQPHP